MCIIYKNGIIRIRRNYLNSAGHALALFERRKDIGKIKSREYGANCGTHRIANGEVTGYAYVCSADFIVPKEFDCKGKSGLRKVTRTVGLKFNLYDYSGNLDEYKDGYVVKEIDGRDNHIEFLNGVRLFAGDVVGKVDEDQLRRIQMSAVGVNTSVFSGVCWVSLTVPSPPRTDAISSLAWLTEFSSGFIT